jgi:hypothetical protein
VICRALGTTAGRKNQGIDPRGWEDRTAGRESASRLECQRVLARLEAFLKEVRGGPARSAAHCRNVNRD